jgi:hypothetical protein
VENRYFEPAEYEPQHEEISAGQRLTAEIGLDVPDKAAGGLGSQLVGVKLQLSARVGFSRCSVMFISRRCRFR